MNKELSLRTLAYLIGYYKSHDETTINLQEIESINFILDENEKLQQENKQLKEELEEEKRINVEDLKSIDRQQEIIQELREKINELKNELKKDKMEQFDDYVIYLQEKYLSMLGENNE